MRHIWKSYAFGAFIFIAGHLIIGALFGTLLAFTKIITGVDMASQFTWFLPVIIWSGLTLISVLATLCVTDFLEGEAKYAWFWPIVIFAVSLLANTLAGGSLALIGALCAGIVSLATVGFSLIRSRRAASL